MNMIRSSNLFGGMFLSCMSFWIYCRKVNAVNPVNFSSRIQLLLHWFQQYLDMIGIPWDIELDLSILLSLLDLVPVDQHIERSQRGHKLLPSAIWSLDRWPILISSMMVRNSPSFLRSKFLQNVLWLIFEWRWTHSQCSRILCFVDFRILLEIWSKMNGGFHRWRHEQSANHHICFVWFDCERSTNWRLSQFLLWALEYPWSNTDCSRISFSPFVVMMRQASLCKRSSLHFSLGVGLSAQVSLQQVWPSLETTPVSRG